MFRKLWIPKAQEGKILRMAGSLKSIGHSVLFLLFMNLALLLYWASEAKAGFNTWTSNGPYGGKVNAIALHPHDSSILYVGTSRGGIFKSSDGGQSWSAINNGLTSRYVYHLVIDPVNPDTVYAGTYYGLLKSTDGGQTWTETEWGGLVYALTIDPTNPDILYLGSEEAFLFKSIDGGITWAQMGDYESGISAIAIDPTDPNTLYAGTDSSSVFKSTDGGQSWTRTELGGYGVVAISIDPVDPNTLYAGTEEGGIFKSTDGGQSWTQSGLAEYAIKGIVSDPTNRTILYAGTDGAGIFKSVDGGQSWSAVNNGLTNLHVLSLAIDPTSSNNLYAGTDGFGVFKTTDQGGTWVEVNNGVIPTPVNAVAIDPAAPDILYAGTEGAGVSKTTDGGQTWNRVNNGLTDLYVYALALDPTRPDTLWAGTVSGIFKSSNGGQSWTQAGLADWWVEALAFDPLDPNTLYAGTGGGGIFKSTDGGENWTQSGLSSGDVSSIAINPTSPEILYAGLACEEGMRKSTNGGLSWREIGAEEFGYENVLAIAIDPVDQNTLYAGTWGLFKSTDGGENWVLTPLDPLYPLVRAIAIDPTDPSTIYAGTNEFGIFKSPDGGQTWTPMSNGLASLSVYSLVIDPVNPAKLYAGTGAGVFEILRVRLVLNKSGPGTGTVGSSPIGINCESDCSQVYDVGTEVQLTATPAEGSNFSGWSGDCSGSSPTITVTMDADKSCVAIFGSGSPPAQYSLVVEKAGTGSGTVTSSPEGINCGSSCSTSFTSGTVVELIATPGTGSTFTGWSGGYGSASSCSGTGACAFILTSDSSITATFTANQHQVTAGGSGNGSGSISSNPAGINFNYPAADSGNASFSHGTNVVLTASANADSTAAWTSCTGAVYGSGTQTATCTYSSLDEAKTATAIFTLKQYTVTASAGAGGAISPDTPHTVNHGSTINITATANNGYHVASIEGCGINYTNTLNQVITKTETTEPITGDCTVVATFGINSYTLILTKSGTGFGTVTSSPEGISCGSDCAEPYTTGTVVALTATADPDSVFAGWGGNCSSCGTEAECSATMDAEKTCTAIFTAQPPDTYTLTVTRAGLGSGTVSSMPGGINCGVDCMEWFPKGSKVFLTASPENGSIFAGWSGDCVGRKATKKVVMKSDKSCTANFALGPDLVVNVVSVSPEPVQAGEKVIVTYQVTNQGDYTTGKAGKVSFILSSDTTIELSDIPLGSQRISKLSPGATVIKTKAFRIGKDVPVGDYFLGLVVDPLNTISETDESNNTAYASLTVE